MGLGDVEVNPPGPVHENVGLLAFVLEFNWTVVVAQPNTPPDADAVGGVTLPLMVIWSVAVQILPPADTVTVRE